MSDLAGKDYFTVEEAAEYARIAYPIWRSVVLGSAGGRVTQRNGLP